MGSEFVNLYLMKTNLEDKLVHDKNFLNEIGLKPKKVFRNLSVAELVEFSIKMNEGILSNMGSLVVETGKFTGRSPDDKFIVDDKLTHDKINWGKLNRPISEQNFNNIYLRMKEFSEFKTLFIFDGFVGADEENRIPIRVITDKAWHCLFATQIFIRPKDEELNNHKPSYTLLSFTDFRSIPENDGTRTETFIILNYSKGVILIGSTSYAGEIKKAFFSIMNLILPEKGIFPMHCSANIGKNGDTCLFFGLSGTGKTTLSADPHRFLIGDDEHGWSSRGIFNFEGGCYAKCINLKKEKEPQIWDAIRFGTVMENIIVDKITREPDFDNNILTENTRVVYPIDNIPGAVTPSIAAHPQIIIFLTADAFGVMPPISKLTKEAAMYHFMSGYTSKLAGTERGITEPKETFSQCFGAPFMPLHALQYAKMLGDKISKFNTRVYLINTGWSGGPYGIGKRIELKYTRAMVSSVINGELEKAKYTKHDIFNLLIPKSCPNVPTIILDPKNTWSDKREYEMTARKLATLFISNFEKFGKISSEIKNAGPKIS